MAELGPAMARHSFTHCGGDVFDYSKEPSEKTILWGELVTEEERGFLRRSLRSELICFSVRDTYQLSVHTVWRPECVDAPRMAHRPGHFAMLLHSTRGRLTTSWTWLKLVRPLYQMGLSVILVDLPGLGRSSINNRSTLDHSVWQKQEGHILCQILDELKVSKCHLVACGRSCSALFRMIKHAPHQLEKEHILHNPVLDYQEIFEDTVPGPAPGTGPTWRDVLREKLQRELQSFLAGSAVKILATFDQEDSGQSRETYESFMEAKKHLLLGQAMLPIEVTREDICQAQIGAKVPMCFYFLKRQLRQSYVRFLANKQFDAWALDLCDEQQIEQEAKLQALLDQQEAEALRQSRSTGAFSAPMQEEGELQVLDSRPPGFSRHGAVGVRMSRRSLVSAAVSGRLSSAGDGTAATLSKKLQPRFTCGAMRHTALDKMFQDPADHRRRILSTAPLRMKSLIQVSMQEQNKAKPKTA